MSTRTATVNRAAALLAEAAPRLSHLPQGVRLSVGANSLGRWLDWSVGRPALAQVKANGYGGVYRYVCSDSSEAGMPGKRLSKAEADQILTAGLDIGLHGEDEATAAQQGYNRGLAQGRQWGDYAASIGAPAQCAIVAAVDYDTSKAYPTVVADYLRGVTDGLAGRHPTGVYGSYYVVHAALAAGHADIGVQTLAWSDGQVSPLAHLYQHGYAYGGAADVNDVLIQPHATWLQGDDMALSADDLAKITQIIHDQDVAVDLRSPEVKQMIQAQCAAAVKPLADTLAQILTAVQGGTAAGGLTLDQIAANLTIAKKG